MKLSTFRIRNCLGFGDSGHIELSTPKDFIYVLGMNSSGKSSLLNAIRYFASGEVPEEKNNFQNFESTDEASGFEAHYTFGKTRLDKTIFKSAHSKFFESSGIRLDAISEHLPNVEFFKKSLEIYESLIDAINAKKECEVHKFGDGDYLINTASGEQDDKDRIASVKLLIKSAANADGMHFDGGAWRNIEIDEYSFENLLYQQFPSIVLFDKRFALTENLPNVITVDWRKDANALTRSFIKVLRQELVDELLITKTPSKRRELEQKIQENADGLVKRINTSARKQKRVELIGVDVSFSNDGLQVTCYTRGKPSYYSQMSDNTKFLFAYHLHQHAADISGNILLFDEPSNGFHATAQLQLLRFLQDLAKEGNQVIVSTHSEHLIDIDYLGGVRLMDSDDQDRLTVRNHFYENPKGKGDYLALRPIYDAIGGHFASQISIKDKIVITEGITDLLYIRAFSRILQLGTPPHLAPGRGDGQVANLVALFIAQGFRCKIILDTGDIQKKLQNDYQIADQFVYVIPVPKEFVDKIKRSGIEDLISKNDFAKVLTSAGEEVPDGFYKTTNNGYLKSLRKRIVAHSFYDKAKIFKRSDFEKETIDNFEGLVEFCRNGNWFLL